MLKRSRSMQRLTRKGVFAESSVGRIRLHAAECAEQIWSFQISIMRRSTRNGAVQTQASFPTRLGATRPREELNNINRAAVTAVVNSNSLPTRLGTTRLIEEFNSFRVQLGIALRRLKLAFDQARCDQAHRRVQFFQSSTRKGVKLSQTHFRPG